MDAIIVDKSDGSQHRQPINGLQLEEASVVKLPLAPESVASFEQSGNDLVIVTAAGKTIIIGDFFVDFGDERNELILVDDDGIAWWGQYSGPWNDFAFAEIGADGVAPFPFAMLGGLGAAGLGGLAVAGGGGSEAAASVFPVLDVQEIADDPAGNRVTVSGNSTGEYVVVTYPDENGNPVTSDPIRVDKDGNWSYDIPRDNISEGDVEIIGTVTDENGNPIQDDNGNPITDTGTATLDLSGPEVDVAITDNGQDGELVLTFSPDTDRDSFDPETDLALENADLGTDGTWSEDADGNQVWTVTITPTGNGEVTATVTDGSYLDNAGNEGSEGTDSESFDVTGPSVTVDIVNEGQTGTVTFTFSEAVTGFDASDVSVGNGALSNLVKVNDTTWTATVTPEATGDVTVTVANESYTDLAGNLGSEGSNATGFDRTAPTVGVEITDNGQDGELVLTFSPDTDRASFDPETDLALDNADLGTDGTWSEDADGNQVWTVTITPTGNGEVTATVTDGSYRDNAGNAGEEGSDSESFDVSGPSVTVSIENHGQTGTVTFTFSEAVTGFDASDVSVGNGMLSGLTKVNDTTWTATVTPEATGDVTVTVANESYTDLAGNLGSEGSNATGFDRTAPTVDVEITDNGQDGELVLTFSPDTDRDSFDPSTDLELDHADLGTDGTWSEDADGNQVWTVTITPTGNGEVTATVTDGSYLDTAGNAGEEGSDSESFDVTGPSVTVSIDNHGQTGTVTFSFSEAVTGFDASDVSVGNGMLSNLVKVNDTTWTATVTPEATDDVTVTVANESYTDLAGNLGSEGSNATGFDRTAPTVGVEITDNGQDGELVLTFSPDTDRASFDPETDLELDHADLGTDGTWSEDADGNQVWTVTITPTGNGEVTATVTDGSYRDNAGNAGEEGSDSESFDVTGPSVAVDIVNHGQTGTVTFTFSEAVTGFDASDVSVGNGALSNLVKVNDTTWTATVTPEATGDVTVTVANESYTDLAGNLGSEGSDTEGFDRTRPEVVVEITDNGQDGELVLTFSPDTDRASFDPLTDLELENADLGTDGTWSEDADGNQVWTVTITPTGNGEVTATVTDGSYRDNAGNAGKEGSDSESFDVTGPSVTVSIENHGQTGTVTFTFSEAVTGFDASDVSVGNGMLSGLTKVNDTTWTATVTPEATGDVTVTVANESYTDLAGNLGSEGSNATGFDRTAPTVNVEITDNGQDGELVLTFSPDTDRDSFDPETDLELDNADLGTDGTWSEDANGNQVWTVTITPTGNGEVTATVTDGSYRDNAGNAGEEGSDSESFDVTGPSVTVDIVNEGLTGDGQTGTVTFTFSEAVTGFDASDVSITNGALSNLTKVNDTTWTATITPEKAGGDVTVTVADKSYTDLVGNVGSEGSDAEHFDRTAPLAYDDHAHLVLGGDDFTSDKDFNIAFVLDFSGSVDNNEAHAMLAAVKAAGQSFFEGTTGDVQINLIPFASDASSALSFTDYASFAAQLDAWDARRPMSGGTDYTAAIEQTMASYTPIDGYDNRVFFLSDGEPNEQTRGSWGSIQHSLQSGTEAAWNSFVEDNDITVQTVGIGDGISVPRLQDIDEADGDNTVVTASNFDVLIDTMLDLLKEKDVSGNVLRGDDNVDGSADDDLLGIDGGYILSITVNGETYTYGEDKIVDGAGDTVAEGSRFIVETAQGGSLIFDFESGDWTYKGDGDTTPGTETFDYVLSDNSGDMSNGTLTIEVEPPSSATDATAATIDSSAFTMAAAGLPVETLGLGALDDAATGDDDSASSQPDDISGVNVDGLVYDDSAESLDAYLPEENAAAASPSETAASFDSGAYAPVSLDDIEEHAALVG